MDFNFRQKPEYVRLEDKEEAVATRNVMQTELGKKHPLIRHLNLLIAISFEQKQVPACIGTIYCQEAQMVITALIRRAISEDGSFEQRKAMQMLLLRLEPGLIRPVQYEDYAGVTRSGDCAFGPITPVAEQADHECQADLAEIIPLFPLRS